MSEAYRLRFRSLRQPFFFDDNILLALCRRDVDLRRVTCGSGQGEGNTIYLPETCSSDAIWKVFVRQIGRRYLVRDVVASNRDSDRSIRELQSQPWAYPEPDNQDTATEALSSHGICSQGAEAGFRGVWKRLGGDLALLLWNRPVEFLPFFEGSGILLPGAVGTERRCKA